MKINIIGDIAGRYDELMLLLEKMPEADLILSVGDMVDRGSQSKQVLEWFMNTKNAEAIYGNHEDLFIQAVTANDCRDWMHNGGIATAANFIPEGKSVEDYQYWPDLMKDVTVSEDIIEWLKTRPMYFQTDDLIVSHAPITSLKNIPADPLGRDFFFIWNRNEPRKPQDKFMIHGHNGQWKRHKWGDGTTFGICIDNSHSGRLTGIAWPSKEVYSVDFLDREEHADHYRDIKAE